MILVLRITAVIDSSGTTQSWYYTDGRGWVTRPSDTPAGVHVSPRMMSAGFFRREMFAGDGLFGAVRSGWGEFVIANADGKWLGSVAAYDVSCEPSQVRITAGAAAVVA